MASLSRRITAELAAIKAQLPLGTDSTSTVARHRVFARLDPKGTGALSLQDVEDGLAKFMQLGDGALCIEAIPRAFRAARSAAPLDEQGCEDLIDEALFRYLLIYLRYHVELWRVFAKADVSGERRVQESELQTLLPLLKRWGVHNDAIWRLEIDHGALPFIEFSDFCLRRVICQMSGMADTEEHDFGQSRPHSRSRPTAAEPDNHLANLESRQRTRGSSPKQLHPDTNFGGTFCHGGFHDAPNSASAMTSPTASCPPSPRTESEFASPNSMPAVSAQSSPVRPRVSFESTSSTVPASPASPASSSSSAARGKDKLPIDWAAVAQLPIGSNPASKAARRDLFETLDLRGDGVVTLPALDRGLAKILRIGHAAEVRPAIARAFRAAQDIAPATVSTSQDTIDRKQFRLVLIFLRRFLELWLHCHQKDDFLEWRVHAGNLAVVLPMLQSWGLKDLVAVCKADPEGLLVHIDKRGTGSLFFDDFADFCVRQSLLEFTDVAELQESPSTQHGHRGATPKAESSRPARDSSHLDEGCLKTLEHMLRPHCLDAIDNWMEKATEAEKRSILRLARLMDPDFLSGIEKTRPKGAVPSTLPSSMQKQRGRDASISDGPKRRSRSLPYLMEPQRMALPVSFAHNSGGGGFAAHS